MIHETIVVGSFQCNCRLLACEKTGHALLVDPGDEPEKIIRAIESQRTKAGLPLQVKYLFHTHGHLDHIGGTREVKQALTGSQICLHRGDEELYKNLQMQGQLFGIQYEEPLPVDLYFEDEQDFQLGELKLSLIHTPGHSPGSVCVRLHENKEAGAPEMLFSGDTLFAGSVGRTDLWGASEPQMFKSIRQRILTLDDDTSVCPGHGPDTSIGREKRKNPFLI